MHTACLIVTVFLDLIKALEDCSGFGIDCFDFIVFAPRYTDSSQLPFYPSGICVRIGA